MNGVHGTRIAKEKESTKKSGSGIGKNLAEILITLTRFQRKSQEHYKDHITILQIH